MRLKLYLNKSLEQNAEVYFEKAKKLKKKLKGAKQALEKSKEKLSLLLKKEKEEKILEEEKERKELEKIKTKKPKNWYQKFHWFISSEGFLCVGGRDTTSNELLIKKHTDKNDLVFHTDISGSPFFIIKNVDNKEIGKETIQEAAIATASFSRAWRQGISIADVYYVSPDQVSKKTKSGEYMGKGAFMIYGKRNYIRVKLEMAVGISEDSNIMGGPISAIKKNCTKYLIIVQGKSKKGEIAKKIKTRIGGELDEIIAALPSGGCGVVRD